MARAELHLRRDDGGPRTWHLVTDRVEVGREPQDPSGVVLPDSEKASRSHALLQRGPDGRWTLTDTSRNGTTVDGELVKGRRVTLRSGARIEFADVQAEFVVDDPIVAAPQPAPVLTPTPTPPPEPDRGPNHDEMLAELLRTTSFLREYSEVGKSASKRLLDAVEKLERNVSDPDPEVIRGVVTRLLRRKGDLEESARLLKEVFGDFDKVVRSMEQQIANARRR